MLKSLPPLRLGTVATLVVIGGFVWVAAQRLSTAPLPDTDESMTLQVPYEMLTRGQLAFPMYQFVGGNIENSWHSFTPVFFLLLSGFLKVVGWGLLQGRIFNLACAALVLLMTYIVGRRMFDWRAGFIAVSLVICDPVFLTRSRLVRNDLLAAFFGLLAFYLFDQALETKKKRYFIGSGLAAGAAVMSHTNLIYILAVLAVVSLVRSGISAIKSSSTWLFAGSALAVMAYEIIYDLVDYRNFVLQNHRDKVHFKVLNVWGWWSNLVHEPRRYVDWYYARGSEFVSFLTLQHIFLILTIVAVIYLVVRSIASARRSGTVSDSRSVLLFTTLTVVLFFALITQRKITQYIVHLAPWFALCVGVMVSDAMTLAARLRTRTWPGAQWWYRVSAAAAIVLVLIYAYQLSGRYFPAYLKQVRDPDLVKFEEIRTVIRDVLPEGVCPAAIGGGYLWLAFPEHDRCFFAHMETTLDEQLELDGKDYALFVRPKSTKSRDKQAALLTSGIEKYHLLAELRRTAYGTFDVYYTGNDPKILSLAPKRYYFFGHRKGHISEDQIAAGRDVWTIEPPQWRDVSTSVELKPDTIYRLNVDTESDWNWAVEVTDDRTGAVILQLAAKPDSIENAEEFFRTGKDQRVRLAIRPLKPDGAGTLSISRIRIREIGPIKG